MILKRKTQNAKAVSLKPILAFLLLPLLNYSQSTIPTTTVSGCLKVDSTMSTSGNLQVTGTSNFDSTIVVNDAVKTEDIEVSGSAKIAGDINLSGKLFFNTSSGIAFNNGSSSAPDAFTFGKLGNPLPTFNPCLAPTQDPWFYFGGRIQLFDQASNVALTMGSDGVQSSIDASGNNGLLINYYCGKNIYLGGGTGSGGSAGTAGAKVYTGDEFYVRKYAQIGANNTAIDPNVILNLFDINNTGIKLSPTNNSAKIIGTNNNQFTVYGDGKTVLKAGATNDAFEVINTSNNKTTFLIQSSGKVFIGEKKIQSTNVHANNTLMQIGGKLVCQELVVLDPVKWADYVFEKDYKLPTLEEAETFYLKNKHLIDVPSAKDVKLNGINSAEMDAILLQKIEELTLYTVELNKQVQELKKENAYLKKKRK
ncbi:MAG: hypothetical protein J0L69_00370 [Bacteroidetes bacterium]|nr:hypothetical protein [Bacteroidota bacterium]